MPDQPSEICAAIPPLRIFCAVEPGEGAGFGGRLPRGPRSDAPAAAGGDIADPSDVTTATTSPAWTSWLYPPARLFGRLGRGALRLLGVSGAMLMFAATTATWLVRRPFRPVQVIVQLDLVGARSVGIVVLSALFTGLVLTLQGYNVLVRFGSENLVGSLVALSLTRELAPVLTALMVTARAGSGMTATIGNMAVTEQLDALKSLSVAPIQYLAVPRLVASVVALPILTSLFSLAGIGAAYLFGVSVLGLDGLAFMSNVRSSVEWSDVSIGLWKALLFGALIALIATFQGFRTTGGARGVGQSTSRTVVVSAVLILCGDYMITALLS